MYLFLEFWNILKGEIIIGLISGCWLLNVYFLCSFGMLKDFNIFFLIGLENISVFLCVKKVNFVIRL